MRNLLLIAICAVSVSARIVERFTTPTIPPPTPSPISQDDNAAAFLASFNLSGQTFDGGNVTAQTIRFFGFEGCRGETNSDTRFIPRNGVEQIWSALYQMRPMIQQQALQ